VTAYGYVQDKDALINRLHRIEGQVRGIETDGFQRSATASTS